MKMTPEEIEKAKRASRRLWCQGDPNGKHDMRPAVIEGERLGHRCLMCGYETQPQTMKANP
jgi:hypothetical protein